MESKSFLLGAQSVLGILGVPLSNNPFHQGIPEIQTTNLRVLLVEISTVLQRSWNETYIGRIKQTANVLRDLPLKLHFWFEIQLNHSIKIPVLAGDIHCQKTLHLVEV